MSHVFGEVAHVPAETRSQSATGSRPFGTVLNDGGEYMDQPVKSRAENVAGSYGAGPAEQAAPFRKVACAAGFSRCRCLLVDP